MSAKRRTEGSLLELWRPPRGAGDPLGCLATTYTFSPGLFDEQCLARFLEIESEPDREDLAFLLERETRLGSVHAAVLVDHTQAGVDHSLRWDVLPVRIPNGKQHAKLSLLAWSGRVRVLVASANLTEPGYRTNFEVAGSIDLTPADCDPEAAAAALRFLRELLDFVPGEGDSPAVARSRAFLDRVEALVAPWKRPPRSSAMRQQLVFNLPRRGQRAGTRALESAIDACRRRGGSPERVRIASPFFDVEADSSRVAAELCKSLARGSERSVCFCVPELGEPGSKPRLGAPRSLLSTPRKYGAAVEIHALPRLDDDKNLRPWHAKMLSFESRSYAALLVGSSNFTAAGLGVGFAGNVEANLLTLVERGRYLRELKELGAVWPASRLVPDPENAEWLGPRPELVDEESAQVHPLPGGFVAATYRAAEPRSIRLLLAPEALPSEWTVSAIGGGDVELVSRSAWQSRGEPAELELPWLEATPPRKLRVAWPGGEAFWSLNVLDSSALPPPANLERMTADDLLGILAAADPSAAIRVVARRLNGGVGAEDGLEHAVPPDLDPLRRYELRATFLHRIRRRARVLSMVRLNLERPVWGRQALEWRLFGLIGVEAVADRLLGNLATGDERRDEALLALADFLIVLTEVDYRPLDGSLSKREFEAVFRPFLSALASKLARGVEPWMNHPEISPQVVEFWNRVEARCRD